MKYVFAVIWGCWAVPSILVGQNMKWSIKIDSTWIMSSPRLVDLNQDNILDVVIGAGAEKLRSEEGILALNGADGSTLWKRYCRDQIYSSALLYDLNQDGVEDVFMCGRSAQMMALNGKDGSTLWEFWPDTKGNPADSGWYNFYQPRLIPDVNGDSIPDLLTANGGGAVLPAGMPRPAGNLMILNTVNGRIIQMGPMPDGRETYFAPIRYDFPGEGPKYIFGSGGEGRPGGLWRVNENNFLDLGTLTASPILLDSIKGFIAHPSLVDLNGDGREELIVPQLERKLVAYDLANSQIYWELDLTGYENYTSPAIGQFVGDPTPDIFATFASPRWPYYQGFQQIIVDGQSGEIAWLDSTDIYFQMCQVNVLDWDGDGYDEIFRLKNGSASVSSLLYTNQFELLDINDDSRQLIGPSRTGINFFSTPAIEDMDNDGLLDVVFASSSSINQWSSKEGGNVERMEISQPIGHIAWGEYLGNEKDGRYLPKLFTSIEQEEESLSIYPNPFKHTLYLPDGWQNSQVRLIDLSGRIIKQEKITREATWEDVPKGFYVLEISHRKGTNRQLIQKE
ncbi:MAG: T9SS type A sorting domain-containing protein [Bacteroidota bacterium]